MSKETTDNKDNKKKKKKVGRPKTEIDYELVERLSSIMCTQEEIAIIIGCDVRTLQRDDEFCRIFKKGKENGKMSLRRKQWKLAENSASMAIFLGKQYLGQRDTVRIEEDELNKLDELIKGLKESATKQ